MKHILWILILFVGVQSIAQKKNFTLAEAVNGLTTTLAVKNVKQLQWMGPSDAYAFVVSNETQNCIQRNYANTFTADTFLTLATLNKAIVAKKGTALKSFPTLNYLNDHRFYFQQENTIWEATCYSQDSVFLESIAKLPANAENIFIDTNNMSVSYLSANNLFVQYNGNGFVKVTRDGSEDIVYGKPVHRDEFGIDKGTFWSPKGNYVAFYRMDQHMVESYPVVNWNEVPATVKNIRYPFAGRTSHQVTLGVYNCETGNTVYLQTGEKKDHYLTTVTWSPDEQYIYVSLLNRDQNHLFVNRYDAQTGQLIKTLYEETNDKYVEPQHPLYFLNNNPDQFIWWSQRDGFMHLYLSQGDNPLVPITSGNWLVNELLGYARESNELVFTGTKDGAMQKNIYAVNLDTKNIRTISTTAGTHTAQLSASGKFVIDAYTNANTPRNIEVINLNDGHEKRIFTALNPLENYNTARVESVTITADDNTPLYGKLIYPSNFSPSKKYPVIVYLYNGPHVQLNKDAFPFSGNLWYDYMAQRGYFVFVMDGRGSSNRGFAFESVTHRRLGTIEMEDQLAGVKYLKSIPQIDSNRMGVHGWSFGGFMTTSLMLRHPGVFSCAVAGGPVLDWSMYEIMYTERYMDSPEQNPEGYKTNLLLDKVNNLKGKLMLIHGTDDDVVVWEHSLRFIKKCVDEGVQIDYFVYPGHPHNVRGKDRVHLMQKISDYFDLYLKP